MRRKASDCLKCPGYCCSYTVISLTHFDVKRLAKYFGLGFRQTVKRYTIRRYEDQYTMKRKADKYFGKICQFFNTNKRRCTIYEARPSTCRSYPGQPHCGYYDFLKFERELQEDDTFVAQTEAP